MAGPTARWKSYTDSRYSTDNDHGVSRTPSPATSTSWKEPYGMPDSKRRGRLLGQLINMEVSVSVRLCEKRMPLEEILALRPGTLLEFSRHHEKPLDLCLNESPVGHGYAVDLEESLGFVIEGLDQDAREDCLGGTP